MKSLFMLVVALLIAGAIAHAQTPDSPSKAGSVVRTPAATQGTPLDLNSASRQQLILLPGIGEAYADKIIAARPFKQKSDLVRKHIISQSTYKKISSRIIAKQQRAVGSTGRTVTKAK